MKIQIGDQIRDMTQSEIDNYATVIEEAKNALAESNAVKASLHKKFAAFGLTESEIAVLVG